MCGPAAMTRVEQGLKRLAGLFAIFASVALIILCGITVVSVYYRYALRTPIHGADDISTLALAVVVAGSIAWAGVTRGHVAVNVLTGILSRRASRVTDTVARLLMLAMLSVAAWAMFWKGSCGLRCGDITPNLGISQVPYYWAIGLGLSFYALVVLVQLWRGLAAWSTDDPNDMGD